jgi:methionyl-tRNA formyltransferase
MKIILLSNNENIKPLYDWLIEIGNEVTLYHEPLNLKLIDNINPELVISFNYQHIIKEEVINRLNKKIINMHISYLPWNKGASPNIWSFIDDTPKGVTIHVLEEGLDTGKIIIQKELYFDEITETLFSTYSKLNNEIIKLLQDNWEMISTKNYTPKIQEGKGSYHRKSDLAAILKGKIINYSMTIKEFKSFIANCKHE